MRYDDEDIMVRLRSIRNLPTLPHIYQEVQALLRSPDTPLDKIADILKKDPSLTLKVLRLVNSAFYGFPGKIKSIDHAVIILGHDTLNGILTAASIIETLNRTAHVPDPARFWVHSFGCAAIAKRIASLTGGDGGEYFTAGLVHDVGKVILLGYFNEEYMNVEEYKREHDVPPIEAEREVLGHTHEEIGGFLVQRWALPAVFYKCASNHHKPVLGSGDARIIASIHMANVLAYQVGLGNGDAEPELQEGIVEFLNMEEIFPDKVIEEVDGIKEELKAFCGLAKPASVAS